MVTYEVARPDDRHLVRDVPVDHIEIVAVVSSRIGSIRRNVATRVRARGDLDVSVDRTSGFDPVELDF